MINIHKLSVYARNPTGLQEAEFRVMLYSRYNDVSASQNK